MRAPHFCQVILCFIASNNLLIIHLRYGVVRTALFRGYKRAPLVQRRDLADVGTMSGPLLSLMIETAHSVEDVMKERLADEIEFRCVVFTSPDSDLLASIEKAVVAHARRHGGERIVENSYLREKLQLGTGSLENWKALVSAAPPKGYLVLKNPCSAMRDWPESSVRAAWKFLSRVRSRGVIVLASTGPSHDDGFCCNNEFAPNARYSYAESDDERALRWSALLWVSS